MKRGKAINTDFAHFCFCTFSNVTVRLSDEPYRTFVRIGDVCTDTLRLG